MNLGVVFAQILESLDQGLVSGLFCKGEIGLGSILWWCVIFYTHEKQGLQDYFTLLGRPMLRGYISFNEYILGEF